MKRRAFLNSTLAFGGAAATLGTARASLADGVAAPAQSEAGAAPPLGTVSIPAASPQDRLYVFFTPGEANAMEALVDRLVPEDDLSPSGTELGIVWFIDRQLAGAFGQGAKTYRTGPWLAGTPNQGYQLPFTPAELYRQGLEDLTAAVAAEAEGATFDALDASQQDALLNRMESGELTLATVPANVFFEMLRGNVIEGLFCDPAYGGNRGMAGWAMIGFPGVQTDWSTGFADWRDRRVDLAPLSMADNL